MHRWRVTGKPGGSTTDREMHAARRKQERHDLALPRCARSSARPGELLLRRGGGGGGGGGGMRQCCCSSGARARSRRSRSGAKRQSWQRPEGGVRDESWRPSRLGLTEVVDEFPAPGTNLAVRRATLANVTALSNRLTNALDIRYPIISAPMAFVGGGALAAAVSRAGGLGLIGGGYGDPEWIEEQFQAAQGERVGVGFITWSAAR